MALEIVWRSPLTLIGPELMLERISSDEFGVCSVCGHSPGSHAGVRSDTGRSCLNSITKIINRTI
jgi:hypothetical protein